MSKSVKRIISIVLILLTVFAPTGAFSSAVTAFAATSADINQSNVFLKQQTPVTCTLSSAAMLMRRTAICADMESWEEITEENIRPVAWTNGVGLRWNYTYNNITIGHGYFSGDDNKLELLNLLEQYPQGFVIYNAGNEGQTHAVFLCDYDEEADIFYVADPASNAPEGRIPLIESTIKGETQEDRINNLDAYWYAVSPVVTVDDGIFTAPDVPTEPTDVPGDTYYFNQTKKEVASYFVVSDETAEGSALRYYPSGSSTVYKRVNKGTILYVEYIGKNTFGADWYKTASGYYIFCNNLTAFEEYSDEIIKFGNTSEQINSTYAVKTSDGSAAALRLEPSEGNNIVAKAADGTKLYIVESGVNSVGAKWLRTQEGYYIKASQTEFVSDLKLDGSDFTGELSSVSGEYRSEPIEDKNRAEEIEPVEYKITASALNVRKSAVDGEVIGVLAKGTVVEVSAILSGWGRINYGGAEGWISLEYTQKVTDTPTPIKLESIRLSSDFVQTGSTVQCTVDVTADVACMYKFCVFNDEGTEVFANTHYQAKNYFVYTPDTPGVYYFYIDIVTNDSRNLSAYSGNFSVHNKLQIGSVKSNADDCVYVNDKIVWTVDTVSDSSSAVYKYSLYLDGEFLFEKDSLSPSFSYIPEKEGDYVLRVYLEDKYSSSEEIESDAVTVLRMLNIDSIKLSAASVFTGAETVCSISVSGGTGKYLYCFTLFRDNKVVKNGAYSSNNEALFTFTEDGTYKILCAVKDTDNSIVSAFSAPIVVLDIKTGDVNNDGVITAGDSRITLRYSAGLQTLTQTQMIAADVNKDGRVNAVDARYILRCAANIENF